MSTKKAIEQLIISAALLLRNLYYACNDRNIENIKDFHF